MKSFCREAGFRVAGFLFIFPAAAWAQPEIFRPAQFGIDNALSRIEFAPDDFDGERTSSAVRCQGFVETDGELTDYYCVSDDVLADELVIGVVRDALKDQKFVPAQVGGTDVRVFMSFAVLIACGDEECSVSPVPNHAYHFGDFGLSYFAPQPILDTRDWYEGFDEKLGWRTFLNPGTSRTRIKNAIESGMPYPMSLVLAVEVDELGNGAGACIYWIAASVRSNTPSSLRRRIERRMTALEEARFIPGFHDGRPARMRLFESVIENGYSLSGNLPIAPLQELMCAE